jgi:CRISPR-associated protein Cmr6
MNLTRSIEIDPYKGNMGLWFYRSFFSEFIAHIDETKEETDEKYAAWLQSKINPILNANFSDYPAISTIAEVYLENSPSFKLKTVYPGLICGSGYEHEMNFTGEFKLGFTFDYTSGLPFIPGSSIKGVLRSAFKHPDFLHFIITSWINGFNQSKEEWPWHCDDEVQKDTVVKELEIIQDTIEWKRLEHHIFDGIDYVTSKKIESVYKTDVFFDSYISNVQEGNHNLFLADDYITSHQNRKDQAMSPFTEPTPLRFLKVRSDVFFKFQFRLFDIVDGKNSIIFSSALKKHLFRQILLDTGLGAKTNVGYGQFE